LKALAVVVAFALAVLAGGRQLGLFDSAQTAAHPLDAKPAADDAADACRQR
jgi:hypothetical protein